MKQNRAYNKQYTAYNKPKHCDQSNKTLRLIKQNTAYNKQNTAINQAKHCD